MNILKMKLISRKEQEIMDDKIIIQTFVNAIKSGKLTLDDVPTDYKVQVKETIDKEEA